MRALLWRLCLACGLLTPVMFLPAHARAASATTRYSAIRAGIQASLTSLTRALAENKSTITTQSLTQAALASMEFGGNTQQAELFLDTALTNQNLDTSSPAYGEIPWDAFDTRVHDINADEYAMQPIGPLLLRFSSQLPADFLARLRPHLQAAIVAMERRTIDPGDTAVYLMKAVSLALLGQALADSTARADGIAELQTWVAYTNENGIHEFASPTYYASDLDSLESAYLVGQGLGAGFTSSVHAILDFIWRDLEAVTFEGALAGAHSRDYSFVAGAGSIELYLYAEGLRPRQNTKFLGIDRIFTWMSGLPGAYHPPTTLLSLASASPREVASRWDSNYTHNRYTYLTRDFAMGSASGSYGVQDKPVNVRLRGVAENIAVVPDAFDDPYGDHTSLDASGHRKPAHIPLGARIAQSGGLMLATMALDLRHTTDLSKLTTSVLLPDKIMRLQTIAPDRVPPLGSRFDRVLSASSVIGVRGPSAALVVRPFGLELCGGHRYSVQLKVDARGLKVHAARLVIYHNCGTAHPPSLRLGFLLLAGHDSTQPGFLSLLHQAQRAHLFSSFNGAPWTVTARLAGYPTLTVSRNSLVPNSDYELINGVERIHAPLVINGRSYHIGG